MAAGSMPDIPPKADSNDMELRLTPWNSSLPPSEAELRQRLAGENLSAYA